MLTMKIETEQINKEERQIKNANPDGKINPNEIERLWTADSIIFKHINAALFLDVCAAAGGRKGYDNAPEYFKNVFLGKPKDYFKTVLDHAFPFICLLNKIIHERGKKNSNDLNVFRGANCKVLQNASEGLTYRFIQFQSTSLDASVPLNFLNDNTDCSLYNICVPKNCPNAAELKASYFKEEQEVLISPYTTFTLDKIGEIHEEFRAAVEHTASGTTINGEPTENKSWVIDSGFCNFYKLTLSMKESGIDDDEAYWEAFDFNYQKTARTDD
mmetsp:Transcript_11186/g.12620  ORF Transcript_11186/g.12620 Transcript_11186/m.12620 type:complete len:272 (-) Transcript_11186:86-901(-)